MNVLVTEPLGGLGVIFKPLLVDNVFWLMVLPDPGGNQLIKMSSKSTQPEGKFAIPLTFLAIIINEFRKLDHVLAIQFSFLRRL